MVSTECDETEVEEEFETFDSREALQAIVRVLWEHRVPMHSALLVGCLHAEFRG